MSEKEMEGFIDRLQDASRDGRPMEGASEEEQQMAALWDDLGELGGELAEERELVSDFKDKLDAYRSGWSAALEAESTVADSKGKERSAFRAGLSYVLTAGVAAVLVLGGVMANSFFQKTDTLQAELRATQETLALSLLDQPSASKRLAGLATLSKIEHPSVRLRESLLKTFDSDTNLNVRLAAVTALQALPREEALGVLLERMEREASPIVQIEILRQVLNLVGEDSEGVLTQRIESMEMQPRVRSFWDENNQSI